MTCASLTMIRVTVLFLIFSIDVALAAPAEKCDEVLADSKSAPISRTLAKREATNTSVQEKLARLNKSQNSNVGVVVIRNNPNLADRPYEVFDGAQKTIYAGSDQVEMARAIVGRFPRANAVFYIAEGFTNIKQTALAATLAIQWKQLDASSQIRQMAVERPNEVGSGAIVDRNVEVDDIPASLFDGNARIGSVSKPEEVGAGEHRGWFKIIVELVRATGRQFVTFYIRSKEVASTVVNSLQTQARMAAAVSAAGLAAEILLEAEKKHPGSSRSEIVAAFRTEFSLNLLVLTKQEAIVSS